MENNNIILFYKPEGYYGCLSNWYPCEFNYMDISFSSSEQYMMYQKAIMFHDFEVADEILKSNNLDTIKKLGRSVKNYDDNRWSNGRLQIMVRGLRAKFSQNIELGNILLSTKKSILAEAAPRDAIWGIGLAIDDVNAIDINKWRGKNLLGKALMQVRKELDLMIDRSTNGIVKPIETRHFPHHFLMNVKIEKLLKYPELQSTLNCYLFSLPQIFQEENNMTNILGSTLSQLENQIYSPWHGYEPVDGFKELMHDINEMLFFGMLDKHLNQKNELYFFSKYWLNFYVNSKYSNIYFEIDLLHDMEKLNFTIDFGKSFKTKYPDIPFLTNSQEMLGVIAAEDDIDLLTSTLFSMYRKITHWDNTSLLSEDNKNWFIAILKRIIELTQ